MSLSLNFNAGAQRAHSYLASVDVLLQRSIERLSSGVRIRRAADDPSAMVLSNGMRHQIDGIGQAIQNCEEGVSMVQTAEAGADSISALLTRMRSLAISAANEAPNDANQLTALQAELDNAISSLTRIATDTRFGTLPLLQGGLADNTLSTVAKTWYRGVAHDATRLPGGIKDASTITMGPPTTGTASPGQVQVTMAPGTPPATALTALMQNGVALSTFTAGTALSITGPDGTAAITLGTLGVTDTLGGVLTAINTATPTTGVTATYDQTSGKVTLAASRTGPFAVAVDQTMSAGTAALFDSAAGATAATIGSNAFAQTAQRGHLEVTFDGRPAGTTLLANLTQEGQAFSGTMPAGTQMTIVGPRGSTVIALGGTTTLDQFTAAVDAASSTTGVSAHYDAVTGIYSLDAEGPGAFTVSVNNAMEAGGSAFLDAAAGATPTLVAGNTFISATSDLRRERMATVLRTAGGAVPSGASAIQGLAQNGTTLSNVGGMLTIGGVTGSVALDLSPTLTIDDLVARINASTSRTGVRAAYDTTLGELALESVGFGRGVLTAKASQDMSGGGNRALMDLNPASATANPLHGPRDVFSMSFVSRSAPAVTALPTASDSIQGLEVSGTTIDQSGGRQFTIFGPDGTQDTMTLATPLAGDALASWVAQQDCTPPLQWTPDNAGGGNLVFDPLGTPQTLAVTASTTAQQLATFLNPFNAGATPSNLSLVVQNGSLAATFNDGFNPPTTATIGVGGTTIQNVLDFINQNATVKNLSASYDSATGALSVTSDKGGFHLASERLTTTATDVGLLDLNTASMDSTGGTKTSSAANATMQMQFTDAAGVVRTITLTQEPGSDGGLGFINLNAGPEMVPPFTGWKAGAFRVTVKDTTTAGALNATLSAALTSQTATRTSTTYIHSGPLSSQRIGLELADLRASALGYSAMRAELVSTDPNKPLIEKRLLNLQDLTDQSALTSGNAQEALRIIDAAIDEVTNVRGRAGAVQANAIDPTVDSLRLAFNNLSDSESRLRDTDYAWESAQYARHQIIYQAATAMLAQANQVPQTVVDRLLQ